MRKFIAKFAVEFTKTIAAKTVRGALRRVRKLVQSKRGKLVAANIKDKHGKDELTLP